MTRRRRAPERTPGPAGASGSSSHSPPSRCFVPACPPRLGPHRSHRPCGSAAARSSALHRPDQPACAAPSGCGQLAVSEPADAGRDSWSQHMAAEGRISHNPNLSSHVSGWSGIAENVGVGWDVLGLMDAFIASPQPLRQPREPALHARRRRRRVRRRRRRSTRRTTSWPPSKRPTEPPPPSRSPSPTRSRPRPARPAPRPRPRPPRRPRHPAPVPSRRRPDTPAHRGQGRRDPRAPPHPRAASPSSSAAFGGLRRVQRTAFGRLIGSGLGRSSGGVGGRGSAGAPTRAGPAPPCPEGTVSRAAGRLASEPRSQGAQLAEAPKRRGR